jgi:hypothetical protein
MKLQSHALTVLYLTLTVLTIVAGTIAVAVGGSA